MRPLAPALTARQMAELDRRTIEDLGVPGLVLMENAAGACVRALLDHTPELRARGVAVLTGPGNNGGDGLAIARRLHNLGIPVRVALAAPPDKLSPDARTQHRLAVALGVPVDVVAQEADVPGATAHWSHRACVVDALLGTGLARDVGGRFAALIAAVNVAGRGTAEVLAVDIPSGIDGETGAEHGCSVHADRTVTFGAPKAGHFGDPGWDRRGELLVSDIGVPAHRWPDLTGAGLELIDARSLPELLTPTRHAHKGTQGHLLVVGGGPGKGGAARLAAEAGLRAGAGLVTLAVPGAAELGSVLPEVMVERLPGDALTASALPRLRALAQGKDAVALGPGRGADAAQLVRVWLDELRLPTVVDADGLNALAPMSQRADSAPRIWTPHPGEMGRLLGCPTAQVQADRVGAVRALARHGGVALLKGAGTLVCEGERCALGTAGSPGMATAGSGDVLTGVLGALLARGLDAGDAARLGACLHGVAGELAAAQHGPLGVTASRISEALGRAASRGGAAPYRQVL